MYQVRKRDGSIVDFDRTKVINAVNAAFLDVDGLLYETDTAEDIAEEIGSLVAKNERTRGYGCGRHLARYKKNRYYRLKNLQRFARYYGQ